MMKKVILDEVISVLFVPRTPHSELAKMLMDITHQLRLDNHEGDIDIGLNRLYDIKMTDDKNELDIMDMNLDMLTKTFEQTVMPENQIPEVKKVQSPEA